MSSSGKGEALGKELGGLGFTGSNQSNDDLKRFIDPTMEKWGRIDALVNSAGHGPRAPLLEITDEQWHAGIDVYFMNVVRADAVGRAAHGGAKRGRHRQHLDRQVRRARSIFPTSAVARAGLAAFTKLFADQYAADNVRMNNVLPGFIDSLPRPTSAATACPCGAMARRRKSPHRRLPRLRRRRPTSPARAFAWMGD